MTEKIDKCAKCGAENVRKLLSSGYVARKVKSFGNKKPGEVVKKYIEDIKQEVKEEKKRLKTQEYS